MRIKQWVHSTKEPPQLDLNDYEIPIKHSYHNEMPRKPRKRNRRSSLKRNQENSVLMESGIEPLQPVDESSGVPKQIVMAKRETTISDAFGSNDQNRNRLGRKVSSTSKIVMVNVDRCSTDELPIENRSSTPKKGAVIDLTMNLMGVVSPILPKEEYRKHDVYVQRNRNRQVDVTCTQFKWKSFYDKALSCKTYRALEKMVLSEQNKVPPLPYNFVGDIRVTSDETDRVSINYIPKDRRTPDKYKHNYLPVSVESDGNCFFRSLSRFVYGVQSRHMEIRCRIVLDSVINFRNYTNNEYLVRGSSQDRRGHIGLLYCDYCGVPNSKYAVTDLSGIEDVLKKDIMRIRKDKEWADIWQMHSAANVLNSQITALYPTQNIRDEIRLDQHRLFWPQTMNFVRDFALLWTALIEDARMYNHIVPLIKRYTVKKRDSSMYKHFAHFKLEIICNIICCLFLALY